MEFGYHGAAGRNDASRHEIYSKLRRKWVADGMRWYADDIDPPVKWDPSNVVTAIQNKARQAPAIIVQGSFSIHEMESIAARLWGRPSRLLKKSFGGMR